MCVLFLRGADMYPDTGGVSRECGHVSVQLRLNAPRPYGAIIKVHELGKDASGRRKPLQRHLLHELIRLPPSGKPSPSKHD